MAFESAFQRVFLYLAAAVVAVLLGKRLGLGAVLGYLIIGALTGPWGFHLMGNEGSDVGHFAEFGVVVMLFLIGLELRPSMLWRMRVQLIGLGSVQVVLSLAALAGVAMVAGLTWKVALAVGVILTMSSTAIAIQTLTEKGLMKTIAGQNSFAVLLFQDMAVIPIIALLPLLGSGVVEGDGHGGASKWMAGWPIWGQALTTVAAVVLLVVGTMKGMKYVFRAISHTRQREAFTGAALLLVVGVALLMTKVGLSPALGAFVAGVVLAGSEYRHELESDLEPFKGILLGLFFLGVGAGIDFGYIREHFLMVVGGAVGLVVVKGFILFTMGLVKERHSDNALLFAAALAAGGEFAFVLISLSVSSGVLRDEVSRGLTAIVALSMATTPILIMLAQRRIMKRSSTVLSDRESDVEDEGSVVIICGFGRFGHAVGRLLRSRRFRCTVLDNDPDQVDLLRRLGMPIYYGDAARPELLGVAGAERAKVLVIALRDVATSLKIIETARRSYPHLSVYVRAWGRVEAYDLVNSGEELIYRDTLDSSIRMSGDVLRELGETEAVIERSTRIYRERDEALLREMASHRRGAQESVSVAKEAFRSLDELIQSDIDEARTGDIEALGSEEGRSGGVGDGAMGA